MMRKPTFPLKMDDGTEARSLEELKEHFSLPRVLDYLKNGTLVTWMRDRNLTDMAEQIQELDPDDLDSIKKLCEILEVSHIDAGDYVRKEVARKEAVRKERILRMESCISDKDENYKKTIVRIADVIIDHVAFDQSELNSLLDSGIREIYLCGNKFSIPLDRQGIKYNGINTPTAVIASREKINWEEKGISFINIVFDSEYRKVLERIDTQKKDSVNDVYLDYQPSLKLGPYLYNTDNLYCKKNYALLKNELVSFHFDSNKCTENFIHNFGKDEPQKVFTQPTKSFMEKLKEIFEG